ncbi:zinc finger protein [Wuchereria bancrofti]|uniref:Zinc finger protein n=1 Tax=Wuchereria bancrofti TaxID=6293 RepID=J9FKR2_WUCBA|nr:zinc finger protein [Wuchereria bancrofti]
MANFFLCYECGTAFSVRNDFDEHILVHQAVSLCYQIYEFDKGGPSVVKAKLEHTSFKESYKPQTVKLLTTFRKTSDCSQKSVRRITTTKRKLMGLSFSPDSPSKVPCLKQKNSQNDTKITKGNKTQDNSAVIATVGSQVIHLRVDKEHSKMGLDVTLPADGSGATHADLLEGQMTSPLKLAELSKTGMAVTTSTTSTGVTILSSPSTSTTSTTAPVLPKCLNCDYRSSQGTDMVEHVVRVHKTSITSLERVDFVDGKWSEAVKLEPRQQCAYCVRTFRDVTDYFLHVIVCHKRNLLSPGVSKYNCIVYLAHPGMPTHMVRIFMKRP